MEDTLNFNNLYNLINLFFNNNKFQKKFENQQGGSKFRNLSCLKKILIILSGNQPEKIIKELNNNYKIKNLNKNSIIFSNGNDNKITPLINNNKVINNYCANLNLNQNFNNIIFSNKGNNTNVIKPIRINNKVINDNSGKKFIKKKNNLF